MNSNAPQFSITEFMAQAGWVRSLALQLVGNEAEAEDLTQETLVAALEHRVPPAQRESAVPTRVREQKDRVRGVLLNRNAGTPAQPNPPLADFLFDLKHEDGTAETLRSDAQGRFETKRSFADGLLALKLREHTRADPRTHMPLLDYAAHSPGLPTVTRVWHAGEDLVIIAGPYLVLPIQFVGPTEGVEAVLDVQRPGMGRTSTAGPAAEL